MLTTTEMKPVSRRALLAFAGAGAVVSLAAALLPGLARADAKAADESIKKLLGGKTPKTGRITLELPQIAENGNTVPIAFEVESPMTETDYVKAVHIFSDQNPNPEVGSFRFTPASGKAKISTRMRMIKTQNVIAVAEMSDGSVYLAKAEVKVTIGGCGG